MTNSDPDFFLILIISLLVSLLFVSFIVLLFFIYQKRNLEYRRNITTIRQNYEQELLKTQIEIQDQTMTHVSREIHDNIGQMLSLVKLNLAISTTEDPASQNRLNDSKQMLSQALTDLRDLSKSLSSEFIINNGLAAAIQKEAERVNKSGIIHLDLQVEGDTYSLDPQQELIFFRIFQEGLNNTLKHAEAANMQIKLRYASNLFTLSLKDEGKGFDMKTMDNKSGSGILNISNRASMVGATASIESSPGNGCLISVSLNLSTESQLLS